MLEPQRMKDEVRKEVSALRADIASLKNKLDSQSVEHTQKDTHRTLGPCTKFHCLQYQFGAIMNERSDISIFTVATRVSSMPR